ncbi:MAG TPA: tRNA dihydrouridine(20/20a) synthase DusA [Vicinamibacterales bacterium]|nr:tRNA dihydrouridine(20/20a) synthase DusA [Vicinamibacterales bacterium]
MKLSIAPMMDVTDRHCRFFLRQVNSRARLYTEMITTGALIHGDVPRHLEFSDEEHPVALQLGGSEPHELARCAKLGEQYGYDEINLNIGCPSERVQRGAFGACLMAEPALVAECVKAIRDAVAVPVTVKHRIGIDKVEDYAFVRDFVGTVAESGCRTFIVHARNAILKGLSPRQNREIPPLKYDYVYRLKRDFPRLEIIINGGITTLSQVELHLRSVDGVMIGRAAYANPWFIANPGNTRPAVAKAMYSYAKHVPLLRHVTRHMLGLYHGMPRARIWRRMLSDPLELSANDPRLILRALEAVEEAENVVCP